MTKHVQRLNCFVQKIKTFSELKINTLMRTALNKIAFLPFAFALEFWRYGVFRGDITPGDYNDKWWDLRLACCSDTSSHPTYPNYQAIKLFVMRDCSRNYLWYYSYSTHVLFTIIFCREKYQGMVPPEKRDSDKFDPGAKYHIVSNVPYAR